MSLASKVALGLGGAGAVGTGSYFAASALAKENSPKPKTKLSKRLADGGFDLLSFKLGGTDNSTEWSAVLTKYKDSSNKDLLKGVTISNVDTDNTNALKSACSSLMDLEDVSDEIYNKARRWCVVPKKVSEILGKLSKTILNNTSTDRSNDSIGTQKVKDYNNTTLPLPSIDGSKSSETEKIQELQKGCKALLEKETKTHDSDFASEYDTAIKWCVSPS